MFSVDPLVNLSLTRYKTTTKMEADMTLNRDWSEYLSASVFEEEVTDAEFGPALRFALNSGH
jgi:hypothetical protein